MMKCFGARNASGFTASIQRSVLPPPTHLTYEGIFNELRFNVGAKTDKVVDIHHHYARYQFPESKFDNDIHDYLALFLKGKADGQPRDPSRRLNAVICLDISGSMTCGLTSYNVEPESRHNLCIEAIKMFISKLSPEDSVGMTTFDNNAHLIFDPILKKDIDESVYERLDQLKAMGGNDLMAGFSLSKKLLKQQMARQQKGTVYENRIIVLSDVCDDSITKGIHEIKRTANEENVNLSIIGVSTDFDSKTCENLKDTLGFNYFCAVTKEDILKHMFETFDYAFFPSANNIRIILQSDDVKSNEVFGAPDEVKPLPYQEEGTTQGNDFLVSHIKSAFPS
jgi:uncharacterized protein YegL